MPASTISPDRAALLPDVTMVRDFVEGERQVKSKGVEYLLPFSPNMDDDFFELYLREAQIGGTTQAQHSAITGALLRRPPRVELPVSSQWVYNSFGDRGQGLMLWLAETLNSQVASSNDWIFVDYPVVVGDMSPADAETAGIYPYAVGIKAEDVLDARTEMIGAHEQLVDFRYQTVAQVAVEDDEFDYEPRVIVTRLYIEEGIAYRQDYLDDLPHGTRGSFTVKSKPLRRLPLFSLNGQHAPVKPMLLPMAILDYHLYNKKSRRNHYNYVMNTSTIITSGVAKDEAKNLQELGGRWDLGDYQAKAYTIGVDAQVLSSSKMVIDEDLNTAAALGARVFADDTREAESAEALAIKNAASHAAMSHTANVFSTVITQIVSFAIYWQTGTMPADGEVIIELSRDFIPTVIEGNDLTAMVNASVQNKLPDEVLYNALLKGELIPDGMTFEDFRAANADQSFAEPVSPDSGGTFPSE